LGEGRAGLVPVVHVVRRVLRTPVVQRVGVPFFRRQLRIVVLIVLVPQ
jgi:hypothetical protein